MGSGFGRGPVFLRMAESQRFVGMREAAVEEFDHALFAKNFLIGPSTSQSKSRATFRRIRLPGNREITCSRSSRSKREA